MRVERTESPRTAIQLPNVPRRLNWVAGQFDGNGHQSCIVEQIGKQMLKIWRNPPGLQEENKNGQGMSH